MKVAKKQTLCKPDFTTLPLNHVRRILKFWDGYVEVKKHKDWLKLFGKRNHIFIQMFTHVSYFDFMGVQYEYNTFYKPFELPQFVRITAIKARTHHNNNSWLSKWLTVESIDLSSAHRPSNLNNGIKIVKQHTKYILEEMATWKRLRSFSLYSCGLFHLQRHIYKLKTLTSLSLDIDCKSKSKPDEWKALFVSMRSLDMLKSLTLAFVPPKGTFSLPHSLKYLHLLYYAPKASFSLEEAPSLNTLICTQLYKWTGFDGDLENILACKLTSIENMVIHYSKIQDISKFKNFNLVKLQDDV
jgi:hypothetical protein